MSYKVAWEQEVGNALSHAILMAAVGAHKLSLHEFRLHQQVVQLLHKLVIGLQRLGRRRLLWQGREAKLRPLLAMFAQV